MLSSSFCIFLLLNIGLLHAAPTNRRFCMSIMKMDCSRGFAPNVICGDDGVTYENDCIFSKAMCTKAGLNELHRGACVVPTTEAPTTTMEPTTENVEDQFCKTIFARNCDGFKDEPICGTDGITYRNDCVFSKALCRDIELDQEYEGPCIVTTDEPTTVKPTTEEPTTTIEPTTVEPTTQEIIVTSTENTVPNEGRCCKVIMKINCTGFEDDSICGSDGSKYANECEFAKASCQDKTLKELVCAGTTEGPITEIPTTEEPRTTQVATSDILTHDFITPESIGASTEEPSQVGTTKVIGDYFTTPDSNEPTTEEPFEVTTAAHRLSTLDFRPVIKDFFCTWTWEQELQCDASIKEYTCGSDHRTYRTKCDMAKAHCDYPTLHVVKDGICPGDIYAVEYKHRSYITHLILP